MKKLSAIALAAVLGWSVIAMAAPTTVTGVLVDKSCYTKDKANTTNEHKGMSATCAQDCAKKGNQVALVTAKGDVYNVTGDLAAEKNAKLVPHMSHTVTLTGEVKDPWGGTRRGASAQTKINRKDFGLTWNKGLETGGVVLGEDVTIDLEIELTKKKS